MKVHQFYEFDDHYGPACGTRETPKTEMTLNMRVTCKRCLAKKKRKTAKGKK